MWISAGAVLVPILVLLGYNLLRPRTYYTGTNSVGLASLVLMAQPHKELCVPATDIPGGTARLGFDVFPYGGAASGRLSARFIVAGRVISSGVSPVQPLAQHGIAFVSVPMTPAIPATISSLRGTVCLTSLDWPVQVGGMFGAQIGVPEPTLAGRPQMVRIGLWFLPPAAHAQRSLIGSWSSAMQRASLFRPGFAGPWLYWVLFIGALPLCGYLALRLLASAHLPGRRVVGALVLISVVSGFSWAVLTAPFDGPDESEHFAYTETIAENGRAPDRVQTARPTYASDEAAALAAIHHFSVIAHPDGRPPWLGVQVKEWRALLRELHARRDDGGGFAPGAVTAPNAPLYYALLVPGYELGRSGGIFTELFWMRMTSVLFGVVIALCGYGVMRELLPRHRRLAVATALLLIFEPMLGFMSGLDNNDMGVNAFAALSIYLLIRALRRGLSWRLAMAIGLTAALLPVMKGTGYALYPAAGFALFGVVIGPRLRPPRLRRVRMTARRVIHDARVWRESARARLLVRVMSVLAWGAGATALWALVAGAFHRTAITTQAGALPGIVPSAGLSNLPDRLAYIWEVFFPRLPDMAVHWTMPWPFFDIYIKKAFAGFGWQDVFFPTWVYDGIAVVMIACGLMFLFMLGERWDAVRRYWREAVTMALAIGAVFCGVLYYYYTPTPTPIYGEQGRYAFPAIVALAVFFLAGVPALRGPRIRIVVTTAFVTAMIGLWGASHLLYLAQSYT